MSVSGCTCKNPKSIVNIYVDFAWKMIQNRVKYNWPLEVQIEFEKADLVNNTKYFKKNWDEYREQSASHAFIANGVSEWGNFHAWLEANPNLTGVKEILEEFKKEYTKKEFFQYVGISRIG